MSIMVTFSAIQVILVVTPLGYLPVGSISATIVHIPVIIAGIALDRKMGIQLGPVFGLTNVSSAAFHPALTSLCFSPFVTIGGIGGNWMSLLVVFVPRILLGYFVGLIYEKLCRKRINENVRIIVRALAGAITSTVLVLGGIYLLLGSVYANAIRVACDILITALFDVVTTNGVAETISGTATTLLTCRTTRPITRKFN